MSCGTAYSAPAYGYERGGCGGLGGGVIAVAVLILLALGVIF